MRAVPAPSLSAFDREPNAPSQENAAPAIDDVHPIKIALRHADLAKLEQVNEDKKGPQSSRAIATRFEAAKESESGLRKNGVQIQCEAQSREHREANEMAKFVVLVEPKAPALRHPRKFGDARRVLKVEKEDDG